MKKTAFFEPKVSRRRGSLAGAMFFDDYEHMLSVIGLLRFALNIPENMVMSSETYEVIEREERKAFIDRHLLETEHIHKEIPYHRKEAR